MHYWIGLTGSVLDDEMGVEILFFIYKAYHRPLEVNGVIYTMKPSIPSAVPF